MADATLLVPFIQKWEGGWVDDPSDRGGATMKGITLITYGAFQKSKGQPAPSKDDLRNMSDEEWLDVFKSLYWDRWKADEIENQSVANILVDWVWASGVWGIKIPQRILQVADDGIVGEKTISKLNSVDQASLFDDIQKARQEFVTDLAERDPSQNRFINGWLNRINAFTF